MTSRRREESDTGYLCHALLEDSRGRGAHAAVGPPDILQHCPENVLMPPFALPALLWRVDAGDGLSEGRTDYKFPLLLLDFALQVALNGKAEGFWVHGRTVDLPGHPLFVPDDVVDALSFLLPFFLFFLSFPLFTRLPGLCLFPQGFSSGLLLRTSSFFFSRA